MSEKSLKDLIEERFETDSLQLPVFNPVALELQKLNQSDTVSMNQIADLIMKDQSLVSHLLRLANSSFYGGLKQVETVSAAVVRLGMNRVTSLAMLASLLLVNKAHVKAVSACLPALWSRTFVCATGGRWLAEQTGYKSLAEEAFLAGLLHDIGELFLLKVLERLAVDRSHPLPLTESLVGEILDAMHQEMGYRLMVKWELPGSYARIARDHHAREFDENDTLLVITRLLDIVCHKLGIGQTADPDIVLAATPEAQALGLKEIKLAQLEILLEDAVAEANELS
ncbi:HDOD domain-containing protein [Thiocystis violascens]|uniref:Putative signal transduction protein n=1 Tax=Thiocystis violascens (strain ATCC 17096 / DSM 198 / 6111) TaxID=765911 RepID=I3YCG2_THIV6|nr:HDOD domain-containing protein [Thiocystis violascens]AFL74680.1 putative signal transduction protein [Thiocystis violascens DSM 198]